MPTEIIKGHEIEYSGVQLPGTDEWAANVAIYAPSTNPMHRDVIFASQRVSVSEVFATEAEAEKEAHKVGVAMVK